MEAAKVVEAKVVGMEEGARVAARAAAARAEVKVAVVRVAAMAEGAMAGVMVEETVVVVKAAVARER